MYVHMNTCESEAASTVALPLLQSNCCGLGLMVVVADGKLTTPRSLPGPAALFPVRIHRFFLKPADS